MAESPPPGIVLDAIAIAAQSPCAKSKRGAVIFWPNANHPRPLARGHNGPPCDVTCDGSQACRQSCGKRCAHAEQRAIDQILRDVDSGEFLDIIHIKVGSDGRGVAGGPPSCPQCAVRILDVGMSGVWLFEQLTDEEYMAWERPHIGRPLPDPPEGVWRRYTAAEFYDATMKNCGVHVCR